MSLFAQCCTFTKYSSAPPFVNSISYSLNVSTGSVLEDQYWKSVITPDICQYIADTDYRFLIGYRGVTYRMIFSHVHQLK